MASADVYNFLSEQNRPYSLNDVIKNIGEEHGKAAIQKALDKLVNEKKIIEKTYAKQRIYCVAQKDVVDIRKMETELCQMDQKLTNLNGELKNVNERLHTSSVRLTELQKKISIGEAQIKKEKLEEEIAKLEEKLFELKENVNPISEEERMKVTSSREKYLKEYRLRKRLSMDVLNQILENYPGTKKHLFEEIGIETDEEVGFKVD